MATDGVTSPRKSKAGLIMLSRIDTTQILARDSMKRCLLAYSKMTLNQCMFNKIQFLKIRS